MKRGLLFSISGLMLAGALVWVGMATESKDYYEPRLADTQDLSASGYAEYLRQMRSNPATGKVEESDVNTAMTQAKALAKSGSSSLNLQWEEMGPTDGGGRTRTIIFDKDDPAKMWAASVSGGIFRSPNGGRSWIAVDDLMDNLAVNSLAQAADGALYAGTGEDMYYFASGTNSGGVQGSGIFKSTDGGLSFNQIPSTDPISNPNEGWTSVGVVKCDPINANRIYAGTTDGFKISDDGGATWAEEVSSGEVLDIVVTPSGAVWVKAGNTILKSANGNIGTYSEVTVSAGGGDQNTNIYRSFSRMRLAVSPQDENYVYVLVTSGSNFSRVYQSTDGGSTWVTIQSPVITGSSPIISQAPFAVGFSVDAYNKERIVVGGLNVHEWSEDGGWNQLTLASRGIPVFYVHVDQHDFVWHPTDTNTFFLVNDGGIFKTTNNGITFTEENKGYGTLQYTKIDVSLYGAMMGGSQDNGTVIVDPNNVLPKSGVRTNGIVQPNGQEFDGDGGSAEFSHLDPEVLFKTTQYGRIGRSINGGDEYSYFYNTRKVSRYSAFSAAFAAFVTPFTLWEKLEDANSTDSIIFKADTIKTSIGFGNGNTRYASQFTKPQSSTKFIAESFKVFTGAQIVTSDASGTLSGDGTGTFDAITGQFTVDFTSGSNLEVRAEVATSYDPGAVIIIESETGEIPLTVSLPNGIASGDSTLVQDPVQAMFAVGLTAFDNAAEPGNQGGGIWMCRDVLSNRTAIPDWWHIGTLNDEEVPSSLTFSHDGDVLFVGTSSGNVYRFSNLTNARSKADADVDIDFLVNPPAASTSVVQKRRIFNQSGRFISNIAVDTEDPDRILITLGNYGTASHVYYTDQATSPTLNNGSFTAKDGNLPNFPVYDAVFNYNDATGGEVLIGTDLGVYSTNDIDANSVSWSADNNGFANAPTFDLLQTRTVRYDLVNNLDFEGAVYAGTHGRGIFRTGTTADFVGIEEPDFNPAAEITETGLELYPNPAATVVSVLLDLENRSDIQISIRDMSGKQVKMMSLNGVAAGTEEISIPVQSLKNGNYLISVINGSDVKTAKLIIRH